LTKKSDYTDPRTNLFELLPSVFQSQTNEAIFEDVFNRYLSKPQIELVDGFAGEEFNNAELDRRIVEPTPHRQAFQLQPLLFSKAALVLTTVDFHFGEIRYNSIGLHQLISISWLIFVIIIGMT